jgi:hypothetical protein
MNLTIVDSLTARLVSVSFARQEAKTAQTPAVIRLEHRAGVPMWYCQRLLLS